MTPKEKAEQLINKMYYTQSSPTIWNQAKQCALIAINEILNIGCIEVPYWTEVKAEIEKL